MRPLFVRQPLKHGLMHGHLLHLAIFSLVLICRPAAAGNFFAGTSPANVPWPGGIVPYEFTNTLTAAETNTYLNTLGELCRGISHGYRDFRGGQHQRVQP